MSASDAGRSTAKLYQSERAADRLAVVDNLAIVMLGITRLAVETNAL